MLVLILCRLLCALDPDLPPFRPYELAHLALDLVRLARFALKPGGRLVFFLPVANDDYEEVDVPVVKGMKLVSNSVEVSPPRPSFPSSP